ncbi:MAG: PIN domain-containing protein [Armatimonadetes bacterium]|nr:PIN domain-containing protein [Armatimonadota bacterium]
MTITGETFFVDTNVLVSATDRSRQHHERALDLLSRVPGAGGHLSWSGQVVREYLVVATRPVEGNGLGLSPGRALENVSAFHQRLHLLPEERAVARRLEALVARHGLVGKQIHDAGVVATMLVHGLTVCISDNGDDFSRFDEVDVVDSGFVSG